MTHAETDERYEHLAEILREVLERPVVRPEDDFYLLGGHSLLILRVVRLLRARHGIELDVRAFGRSSQVAALAQACRPAA